jgi:hypothetical protein
MGWSLEPSVVNRRRQARHAPTRFIVDRSKFATGGAVNPTPALSALAFRAAER